MRRRGFTLIELLVVIAIIAVLIALLLARRAGGTRGGAADRSASTTSSRSAWPCTTTTRQRAASRWAAGAADNGSSTAISPSRTGASTRRSCLSLEQRRSTTPSTSTGASPTATPTAAYNINSTVDQAAGQRVPLPLRPESPSRSNWPPATRRTTLLRLASGPRPTILVGNSASGGEPGRRSRPRDCSPSSNPRGIGR